MQLSGQEDRNELGPIRPISFSTWADAYAIIEALRDRIKEFKFTTVAEYYTLSHDPDYCFRYADYQWGWSNLNGTVIRSPRRGEYEIIFPQAQKLI